MAGALDIVDPRADDRRTERHHVGAEFPEARLRQVLRGDSVAVPRGVAVVVQKHRAAGIDQPTGPGADAVHDQVAGGEIGCRQGDGRTRDGRPNELTGERSEGYERTGVEGKSARTSRAHDDEEPTPSRPPLQSDSRTFRQPPSSVNTRSAKRAAGDRGFGGAPVGGRDPLDPPRRASIRQRGDERALSVPV